jgi:release factor glutamine methyltransferase
MKATIQYIEKELGGLYPESEIKSFSRIILEQVCGMDYTAMILKRDEILDPRFSKPVKEIVKRLKRHEPVQYIFGETEFMDLKLKVTPSALIPRPETEELVQWIGESGISDSPFILDIGTGSGCIALALKKQFPEALVSAVDYSAEALEIARGNAETNNLQITLFQADILNWQHYVWGNFDLIVSNPPYVRESEKAVMQPNVLEHEPGSALFVPDDDPLLFYRYIAGFAKIHLNEKGWLFFEINESLGTETADLLEKSGFREIEVKKDLFGKNRMLRCRR